MQYLFLILYIIVSCAFAYIKTNYIEAAYYMVSNSAMYSVFMPLSVIVPLGLLFGKFIFDCKLKGNKTVLLVVNTILFIVCILGYIFVGLHHPEFIYYILYLASEELMVIIFALVKKEK
ncbi:MAG: hypothetical protein K5883_03320 [Pseudobutyrivibrio sp.]|nr:hypothetical protein [Pseudobutyrivibrio sp.]